MKRDISAPTAAYAARCKPVLIRDWRYQGYLKDFGIREGKGHVFSIAETVRIAIAVFLVQRGFGLREAFELVSDRAAQIEDLTKSIVVGAKGEDYLLTIAFNADLGNGVQSITAAPLSRVRINRNVHGALQVNLSVIIRSAMERLSFHNRRIA